MNQPGLARMANIYKRNPTKHPMTKQTYLQHEPVAAFVKWLAARLDSPVISHSWRGRKSGKLFESGSIYDAYTKYKWGFSVDIDGVDHHGHSFAQSHDVLEIISAGLKQAIRTRNDGEAVKLCHAVLRWGGVIAHNGKWIEDNRQGLSIMLSGGMALFSDGASGAHHFIGLKRFNAGMTKVYSVVLEDFIIYDSRVAAALGWLVAKFCRVEALEVPDALRFPWMPAKEALGHETPKNRNPSCYRGEFPRMNNSPSRHALWNLRASWLLQAVLEEAGNSTRFNQVPPEAAPLRRLEAALFMIGYDLGDRT